MTRNILLDAINLDFAKNTYLFSGLTDAEKDLLINDGELCAYPRKKFLFRSGEPVAHFYIVHTGTIQLFHETPQGREVTTDIRIAGDVIGATGIFDPSDSHRTHALAITDVIALKFSMEWLKETVRRNGTVSANLLSDISQRTHRLKIESENKTQMSAMQILGCFLLHLCVEHRLPKKGFNLPYKKSLIASRLGMEKETFSRNLTRLKKIGINIEDRHISFYDLPAIEENICSKCSFIGDCDINQKVMSI